MGELLPFCKEIRLVSLFRKTFCATKFTKRKAEIKITFGREKNTNMSRLIISCMSSLDGSPLGIVI